VVDLVFEDGCTLGIAANLPTSTATLTPTITDTPTITPTPDCSLYSKTGFTFLNSAIQRLSITNGDVVDAEVDQIQFSWSYAENYGSSNGYPNLQVDWFTWNGGYFHLGGNGDLIRDFDSSTIWNSGTLPFNSGSTYNLEIDFDADWAAGGVLSGVINNDFGIIIDFTNGCQLNQSPVARPIISWTPTNTPTVTYTPTPPPPPTATSIPTQTPLPTATPPPTLTFTPSWTPSITPTASDTPVATNTSIPTITIPPPTVTNSPVPSITPVPSQTNTPLPTNTHTPTPIPTWTPACPYEDPEWPCQPTWTPTP